MKLIYAVLFLVVVPQPASAQECSGLTHRQEQMDCVHKLMQRLRMETMCDREHDELGRVECMRAWQVQQTFDSLCNTDALKKSKVACLERRVDALSKELTQLRDLPKLIDEQVRAAMQPRLHK